MAVNTRNLKSIAVALPFVACCLLEAGVVQAQANTQRYDMEMYRDPALEPLQFKTVYASDVKEVWKQALERDDAAVHRVVVDSMVIAHRRGIEGIDELVPKLVVLLDRPNQTPDVGRAIINTLVALDQKDQAAVIARMARSHAPLYAEFAEPALAKWKSPLLKDEWLQRVSDASARQRMLVMALDGLAAIESKAAFGPIENIFRTRSRTVAVRVAAARALAAIDPDRAAALAAEIAQADHTRSTNHVDLFAAIELLQRSDSKETIQLLKKIASDGSGASQARALGRLFAIDTSIVDEMSDDFFDAPDVNSRRWCALAMISSQKLERIETLAQMLNDVNPGLRKQIAESLIDLAKDANLKDAIIQHTVDILRQEQWQGCEQAAYILAKQEQHAVGPRLVELLGHSRGEVQVASAWALKQLDVKDLLPDMLDHAAEVRELFESGPVELQTDGQAIKAAHLFLAFGKNGYLQADPVLRGVMPKNHPIGEETRAAAAWALGILHEDKPDPDLIELLAERLMDAFGDQPEARIVRQMCAVGLGRMGSEDGLRYLRRFANNSSPTSRYCSWAIEQITGEPAPKFAPFVTHIDDWLIAPLPEQATDK